jgi:hypothetical protein
MGKKKIKVGSNLEIDIAEQNQQFFLLRLLEDQLSITKGIP